MTAFDALAPSYDADFTQSPIAAHLRARVGRRLLRHFKPGAAVLELGCGTGEDARFLAAHGFRVIATDTSAGMIEQARLKNADQPLITCALLDLNDLPLVQDVRFTADHAFSNFGAINCVQDRRALAAWLAAHLPPGGTAAFGVMSPLCLWEIGWHGLHGEFGIAFRRQRGFSAFQIDGSAPMRVYYPTIGQITRAFAPYFRRVHVEPLGLFLPPTAGYRVIERRPRLLRMLTKIDDALTIPSLALFADHYWIEFERRA
ncbi:MAG: methyltransferase domain-containing protein [bacterium]|nr:methyltransferase domain-containing protein [bacterium]